MNNVLNHSTAASKTSSWRLWIDRCGGYELVQGNRWSIGGARPGALANVQVQTDWRRIEGHLVRGSNGHVWQPAEPNLGAEESLINHGDCLPISGAASLCFRQPSPLSGSAVLSLNPPHRFGHHVDAVVLVDQTVLVGRDSSNHIQAVSHDCEVVLVLRNGTWQAKLKPGRETRSAANEFVELVAGRRISVGEMDMTLEQV